MAVAGGSYWSLPFTRCIVGLIKGFLIRQHLLMRSSLSFTTASCLPLLSLPLSMISSPWSRPSSHGINTLSGQSTLCISYYFLADFPSNCISSFMVWVPCPITSGNLFTVNWTPWLSRGNSRPTKRKGRRHWKALTGRGDWKQRIRSKELLGGLGLRKEDYIPKGEVPRQYPQRLIINSY